VAPEELPQRYELAIQRARKLREKAAALCESSRNRIDISFRLMELDDIKKSRNRSWLEALAALSDKKNGQAFEGILDLAVEASDADFGNIQVYDPSARVLRIVANRGLGEEFLKYFADVHTGTAACGTAMQRMCRVIIPDVANDSIFDGESREILLRADVGACQSTPLVSSSGRLVGMLSTHYRRRRTPPVHSLPYLDYLAQRSAALLCPIDLNH